MKYRVLIVDDDQLLTASLESVLKHCGYDVSVCSHGTKALPMINNVRPDVVLLDIYLGDTNGIEILKSIKSNDATLPVVMITAYSDVKLAVEAMKLGSEDFIVKPLDIDQLEVILSKALRTVHLQREVNRLKNEIDDQIHSKEIIGTSPAIKSTLKLAERFAQSEDTTVLIEGESGVGKELFARYIHRASLGPRVHLCRLIAVQSPKNLPRANFLDTRRVHLPVQRNE